MSVVCTIFEKDYHYGALALLNSLLVQGFEGRVVFAYRGVAPFWEKTLKEYVDKFDHPVAVNFLEIEWKYHPANYKPILLQRLIHEYPGHSCFYFDPDIVVLKSWHLFERWVEKGFSVCWHPFPPYMPSSHPLKKIWSEVVEDLGKAASPVEGNVNSGFVGARERDLELLACWEAVINDQLISKGNGLMLPLDDPDHPFRWADQDALNAAILGFPNQLSIQGTEAMGFFSTGLAYMAHAIERPKPWRNEIMKSALRGSFPSFAATKFWEFTLEPFEVFPKSRVRAAKRKIFLAKIIKVFWKNA